MLLHRPSVAGTDLHFSRPVSYKLVQSFLANCQSQFGHSDDRTYSCYFYNFTILLGPILGVYKVFQILFYESITLYIFYFAVKSIATILQHHVLPCNSRINVHVYSQVFSYYLWFGREEEVLYSYWKIIRSLLGQILGPPPLAKEHPSNKAPHKNGNTLYLGTILLKWNYWKLPNI